MKQISGARLRHVRARRRLIKDLFGQAAQSAFSHLFLFQTPNTQFSKSHSLFALKEDTVIQCNYSLAPDP